MKGWCWLVLLIVCAPLCFAQIIISEVFSNPIADESLNEWIELYNNGSPTNLSGWLIGDEKQNNSILGALYNGEGTILEHNSYALLTDEMSRVDQNFNISGLRLYIDDSAIGKSGLSNSGGILYLHYNNSIEHSITYPSLSEGYSWQYENSTYNEGIPTPGYGPSTNPPKDTCDWILSIEYNTTSYQENGDLNLKIIAQKQEGEKAELNSTIHIQDYTQNTVRSYAPFTNHIATTKKSSTTYNPTLNPTLAYLITANLSTNCTDSNPTNNALSEWILPSPPPKVTTSSIVIDTLYDLGSDHLASYGQTIRARLRIYKGESTKKTIKLWAEKDNNKISKQTQINLDDPYTNYTITLPLQLIPNCKEKHQEGRATLIASGLDTKTRTGFDISGITPSLCEKIEVSQKPKRGRIELDILELPTHITPGEPFSTTIRIANSASEDLSATIWGYVYRGNKKYSGAETLNMKYITLLASQQTTITLNNLVKEAKEGDYQYKIKLQRQGRKTAQEITQEITILPTPIQENTQAKEQIQQTQPSPKTIPITGAATTNTSLFYNSDTEQKVLIAPLLGILFLLALVLGWLKK